MHQSFREKQLTDHSRKVGNRENVPQFFDEWKLVNVPSVSASRQGKREAKFLGRFVEFGPAVRLCGEGRATGPPQLRYRKKTRPHGRKTMRKKKFSRIAIKSFSLLLVLGTAYQAVAQAATTPSTATTYPKMAPIDQYLMTDQSAEIALARSAAPESISRDAKVLVLGRHGFEMAVKGKNGFVCIVERSWTSAADADFWNQQVRTPICYNAAAARSFLLRNLKRTDLILAGRTKAEVDDAIFAAVDKKELPAMEYGAMCYMMSKQGYGGDSAPHWPSHLMFFYSQTDPATWGANLPGSPILAVSDEHEHMTEHLTMFSVAVQRWSDGTQDRTDRTK
jgi:hypothetical protein